MFHSILRVLFAFAAAGSCCLFANEGITDAEDYKNNSSLQWKWAVESLENFPLDDGDKILDLGCGHGTVTALIASKVPSGYVIGLDISQEMLSHAQRENSALNIIYMQGDIRKLPFSQQFDKVIAFLSLNWVKEQNEALLSIYDTLKPGGKAVITRPGKQPSNLGPATERLVKSDRWASYFPDYESKKNYYTVGEYRALLEAAGFAVETISEQSTATYFQNREALLGFFRPICTFIGHLSLEMQRQFLEEIVDEVLKFNKVKPDGSILLQDLKLEAVVQRRL